MNPSSPGRALAVLLAAAVVTMFANVTPARSASPATWWNDAVFYEIFVRSFADSDGDGVGDLRGLIDHLDYLNDGDPATTHDLGVTGLWLMPITESPSYHGYDVMDYEHIDREYGTNDDFRELMDEAHRRGIRVIVDLVLNHTSRDHPWFRAAEADRRGETRDWYIWRDTHPGWRGPWGAEAWHRSRVGNEWYYGVFSSHMPDLNYRNDDVTRTMRGVVKLWLTDLNADGFRLDAVKHLIEDGENQENTAATHAWFREHHEYTKSVKPEALVVGEVWSSSEHVLPWIGANVDLAFEFSTAGAMLESARKEDSRAIRDALRFVTTRFPPGQWATFLANHDQDRVMKVLRGNGQQARSAASLLLTAPGVPFLYYGEEVGQTGGKPDENIRTPMQWSAAPNAGFTQGPSAWRSPQADYATVHVAAQQSDSSSLLSHYRRLVHLRNEHPALRRGAWIEVESDEPGVYACLRASDDETLLVLINLTGHTLDEYSLSLGHGPFGSDPGGSATGGPRTGGAARDLLSQTALAVPVPNRSGGFRDYTPLTLPPYATAIVAFDESPED